MEKCMKITVLGCGSSLGVPALKYGWGECDPNNPKNKRTRSSIIVEDSETVLLVDTSPDLTEQLLRYGQEKIDAVLFTHAHFDHVNGINELRPLFYSKGKFLDIFATKETLAEITSSFPYLFRDDQEKLYASYMKANEIHYGKFKIGNISGICFEQNHGYSKSLGFRIKNFAYSTDVMELNDDMIHILQNLDVWIVDCLCKSDKRPTHANLDTVLDWIEKLKPKKTYLTHMDTSMDYDTLMKILPKNVEPAYDQLTIEI